MTFGMKISPPGVSALSGADKDMVIHSEYSMLKGALTGTGTIAVPRDGNFHSVTIAHGLGYIPMVQGLYEDADGIILNADFYHPMPDSFFVFDELDNLTIVSARMRADDTNIYIDFAIEDVFI